jgi:hypothetical protein
VCVALIFAYRSQLGGTGRAGLDVSVQAFLGGIPLLKRFLLDLKSLTGYCADKIGVGRQEYLSPAAESHIILLSQPVVFGARHDSSGEKAHGT